MACRCAVEFYEKPDGETKIALQAWQQLTYLLVDEPVSLLDGVALVPELDESAGAGVAVAADEPEAAGAEDVSGVVAVDDDEVAGAGVLTGAESAGALEVAGVAGVSSLFLQPARAAKTTAVANTVLRINIGPPCS